DRYFQPVAGQSAANDMYFARAQWVFDDNHYPKGAIGSTCDVFATLFDEYTDPTIADLLKAKGVSFTFYAEGYKKAVDSGGACANPPADCPAGLTQYPCLWDPSDDPFQFYPTLRDQPGAIADLQQLLTDSSGGTLPAVSYVKALGYKTEHPGQRSKISDAM